jgi:hypothetical protein
MYLCILFNHLFTYLSIIKETFKSSGPHHDQVHQPKIVAVQYNMEVIDRAQGQIGGYWMSTFCMD